MFKKYTFFRSLILVVVSLIFLLTGCAKKQPSKLILAENRVPVSAVTIIAYERGFFENEDLNIIVKNFASGKFCLDAVVAGAADFATVAETPLMRAGLAGQKVKVVATFEYSDNDIKVLARRDKGIKNPQDLKGKKIATLFGTSAEFFTSSFLNYYGLETSDVKMTNLNPPNMITAIDRGDVDAIIIWEPHVYNGKKLLGDNGIIFELREIYIETFNIAVKEELIQKKPQVIKRFLQALIEAENYIQDNREEAIRIVADYVGMDSSTLNNIWDDFNFDVHLAQYLLDFLTKEAIWAKKTGTAPGFDIETIDFWALIYPEILKQIDSSRVRFD